MEGLLRPTTPSLNVSLQVKGGIIGERRVPLKLKYFYTFF